MPAHLHIHRNFLPQIEGWRGLISFWAVVLTSCSMLSPQLSVPFAYLGSDFFFCISGFILTRQYEVAIATRTLNFRQLLLRRIARLYPLYLLSLVLFLMVDHYVMAPHLDGMSLVDITPGFGVAGQLLAQLTMTGNLGFMPAPWHPLLWSVSVEWLVSLLFFFFAWNLHRVPTTLWVIFAGFSLMYLVDTSPKSLNLMFSMEPVLNPTIARGLMSFSIGALVCRFHRALPVLPWLVLHLCELLLIAVVFLSLTSYSKDFLLGLDYVFVLLLFPLLLMLSLYKQSWVGAILSLPPFVLLGRISYSTYLLSLPLLYLYQFSPIVQHPQLAAWGLAVGYAVFLLVASTISYMIIEMPIRLALYRKPVL